MNRIEAKFQELKQKDKKAFIAYICAGDPTLDDTETIINTLEEAGVDIIELGIPFSDPLADGPTIQESSLRALESGFRIKSFFEKVKEIRKSSSIPLTVMVYYSSIFGYGKEEFIKSCDECGLDGIIIPDLPYEEYDEINDLIDKTNLCFTPLISVTSKNRAPMLVKGAKGFIYCVSSLGVTGHRDDFHRNVDEFIKEVKALTDVPVCVGFGISKREHVERFNSFADGVIVGSAIVQKIYDAKMDKDEIQKYIRCLIK